MHGVFGLRITLGRPFPESLPVVSPTSSPSPLRNSPGFPPGSPRPHRGRTMHATQISTCARNSRRAVPPTPCRSRPISPLPQTAPSVPCRRRVGHVGRCSTWTWGVRPGQYLAPPWQFGSTRHPVARHVAGTTIPNTSATETNGSRPALQTEFTTPRRAPHTATFTHTAGVAV